MKELYKLKMEKYLDMKKAGELTGFFRGVSYENVLKKGLIRVRSVSSFTNNNIPTKCDINVYDFEKVS